MAEKLGSTDEHLDLAARGLQLLEHLAHALEPLAVLFGVGVGVAVLVVTPVYWSVSTLAAPAETGNAVGSSTGATVWTVPVGTTVS